jgi:ribonucleoside-diphosphate reductase alpha chain
LNQYNPTPHIGLIESTNPCGEQPLLPYESCNLGSINLGLMVKDGQVDWEHLKETVHLAVHFMDNVIELNQYPLPEIARMTYGNRKIGLGIMGWADMLIAMGIPYNSDPAIDLGERIMKFINDEGHDASRRLAEERGPFSNFEGSVFSQRGEPPIRNATVTTIAPTGTISIIANASSGIEPIFAVSFVRQVLDNNTLIEVHPLFENMARDMGVYSQALMGRIAEHGTIQDMADIPSELRRVFVTAHDITPEDHIRMQAAFQKNTDNAVSKTVNFPKTATIEEVMRTYTLAYELGCKGVTIYRDGSRENQVLSTSKTQRQSDASRAKTVRDRPASLKGWTYRMQTGCGPLYVTINEDESGLFELFTTMGKAGGCAASQSEAIGRMVSLAWRSGVQPEEVTKQLMDISCHSHAGFGPNKVLSCADAVAKAIRSHMASSDREEKSEKRSLFKGACRECGGQVEHEGGCSVCHSCGFSECF